MSPKRKKLTSSLEDYLEAILELVREGRVARVRDIASRVGVGKSAVTAALKNLSARGLVNYDPYQVITLTDQGREVAEEISRSHVLLRRFLTEVLGLDVETAEANACRLEHAADAELLRRLRAFTEFLRACPRAGKDLIQTFHETCFDPHNRDPEQCDQCMNTMIQEKFSSRDSELPHEK